MARAMKKEMSKSLSGCLDELGFDRRRIRERIHVSNRSSRAKDISTKRILKTDKIEKIFVGSYREGIGLDHLNDLDVLQINHGIECVKQMNNVNANGKLIFKMVQNKAPAGYTFLKLVRKEANSETLEKIKYAVVKAKNGKFLSSQLFMTKNDDVFKSGDGFICRNTVYKSPKGPAIPKYVENDLSNYYLSQMNLKESKMDFVRAFPCNAETILDAWKKRERRCGWPSKKTIAHVITLPAYVVPTGKKGSKFEDLQWRISLIMAEIHLVQDFNSIQTKVFVLMKLIVKHILHPICKDITSYVVKMVMLWLAEKKNQKKFRQKHLVARLNDALKYLKVAVENKCLPCYMIPNRNLFMNKLQGQHQKTLILKLDFLLENGSTMISDFFKNLHPQRNEILQVCHTIYAANFIDKINTCQTALFSTQELADYFLRMFFASSWWHMPLYNILFHLGPFFITYGKRGFSDPLSFELSRKFAASEKNEQAALKKKKKNQETVECHNSRNKQAGLTLDNVMLYSAILLSVLLILPNRLLLALILRVFYSDGIVPEAMHREIISE